MSRIGKMPITVTSGVDVKITDENKVTVKGPKGTLENTFHKDTTIRKDGGTIFVERPSDEKTLRSQHGLIRTLINNMVVGVTAGFEKTLDITGVGYRAQKQGKKLLMTLGYSHPVEMEDPAGITTEVVGTNRIIVRGIDKQAVGEFAAKIRIKRKPEVYKGKGIRYQNEVIRRKEGKSGAKGRA